MERKKLIFLDIDGTLTPPGTNTPPESALEAIRAAREKGHKIFLCTGRNPAMTAPLLRYGFDGVVNCAGGYITCGEEVIYDRPMTPEEQRDVTQALSDSSVFCIFEAKDASFGDDRVDRLLQKIPGRLGSEMARWRRALEEDHGVVSLSLYDGRPVYKVSFMCLKKKQLRKAEALLEGRFQFCLHNFVFGIVSGELLNRAFSKGEGLRRICARLGAAVEDTIGFGDSINDLTLLETAAVSVCMGNGSRKVKKIADFVCPPVDKDGLAAAFAKLGLV